MSGVCNLYQCITYGVLLIICISCRLRVSLRAHQPPPRFHAEFRWHPSCSFLLRPVFLHIGGMVFLIPIAYQVCLKMACSRAVYIWWPCLSSLIISQHICSIIAYHYRWYKRSEAQKRYSFLVSTATLANGFGGLLAFAIGHLDGVRGYSGWRWIFFIGTRTLLSEFVE